MTFFGAVYAESYTLVNNLGHQKWYPQLLLKPKNWYFSGTIKGVSANFDQTNRYKKAQNSQSVFIVLSFSERRVFGVVMYDVHLGKILLSIQSVFRASLGAVIFGPVKMKLNSLCEQKVDHCYWLILTEISLRCGHKQFCGI